MYVVSIYKISGLYVADKNLNRGTELEVSVKVGQLADVHGVERSGYSGIL